MASKRDFLWANVDKVLPNPKNPRKDPGVRTKDIQNIIKNKGWEEGITVYKKGIFYIILSGHRRWYAAKELGVKEVPLYIVEAPKNDTEELERLGSVQSGQVDWTAYEWAEYTYNMSKSLGTSSYSALATKFNVSHNTITGRIRVYQYYPRNEIEQKLEIGVYSISNLESVRAWIERFKKHHPKLHDELTNDMIRQMMLKKLENKKFGKEIRNDTFVEKASDEMLLNFMIDSKRTLEDYQKDIEESPERIRMTNYKVNSRKVKLAVKDISNIEVRTKKDATRLLQPLDEMEELIISKREHLKKIMEKEHRLV